MSSEELEMFDSIPLCIDDLLIVCKAYSQLGFSIQNQIENILDMGVDESIKTGKVKRESLPFIRDFLHTICKNPYFGESIDQANECIAVIKTYEVKERNLNLN